MKSFCKLLFSGALVELGALLTFIWVAKNAFATVGKLMILGGLAGALLSILWRSLMVLPRSKAAILGVSLALTAVLLFNAIGFMFYPGLVKDVDLLSEEHCRLLLNLSTLAFAVFFLGLAAVWIARQLIARLSRQIR